MMGPNLAAIAHMRTYASVANPRDVAEIHKVRLVWPSLLDLSDERSQQKDIPFDMSSSASGKCPHAKAAGEAAALAQREAEKSRYSSPVQQSAATGMFNYLTFYETELEKKHKDK